MRYLATFAGRLKYAGLVIASLSSAVGIFGEGSRDIGGAHDRRHVDPSQQSARTKHHASSSTDDGVWVWPLAVFVRRLEAYGTVRDAPASENHILALSSRAFAAAKSVLPSLLSFPRGVPSSQVPAFRSRQPVCLAAPSGQAPTPARVRHQAQGLDCVSAGRAIIGHRTDDF